MLPVQSKKIIGPFSEDADFYDIHELVSDKSKKQHQWCCLSGSAGTANVVSTP